MNADGRFSVSKIASLVLLITLTGAFGYAAEPVHVNPDRTYSPAVVEVEFPAEITTRLLWGFIDSQKRWVISPRWLHVEPFQEQYAVVAIENGTKPVKPWQTRLYGAIDRKGDVVIPPKYASVRACSEGLFAVESVEGGWGYVDTRGEVVIPLELSYAESFSEGVAVVKGKVSGGKFAYLDRNGRLVLKNVEADILGSFHNGLAVFYKDGRAGYLDRKGNVFIDPRFENARDFSEGLAAVDLNGKWGYIDKTGKFAISPRFYLAGDFCEGRASASMWLGNTAESIRTGVIDKAGKWTLRLRDIEQIEQFSEGLAVAGKGAALGFIDRDGRWVVLPQYGWAQGFVNGFAVVSGSKVIDTKGDIVRLLPPRDQRPGAGNK